MRPPRPPNNKLTSRLTRARQVKLEEPSVAWAVWCSASFGLCATRRKQPQQVAECWLNLIIAPVAVLRRHPVPAPHDDILQGGVKLHSRPTTEPVDHRIDVVRLHRPPQEPRP